MLMQEIEEVHPMDIEDRQDDIDYEVEKILEINYLDALFGLQSKMSYD